MVKIAFFEISEQDKAFFRKNVNGSMVFYKERLSLKNIEKARGCEVVCISIYSKINKAVIDKLPSLKFIATRSTGYDHIDTRECRKRGIAVSNVPDYSNNAVAEHTFALILALFRNMKSVLKGVQERSKLSGAELKGKTIGVIGTGKIGMNVIRIAKGFGMKVIAYDINKNIKASHTIGFKYTSLDYLFRHADIITLHVPYTEKTHHLINKENINNIKKGSVIINTSRGRVIETQALIEALDKGILAGAGLDVLEYEEKPEECRRRFKRLFRMANVIVTPHIAACTREAMKRLREVTAKNINAFIRGKAINLV